MNKEQIKELWEWCGFQFFRPIENGAIDVIYPGGSMYLSPSKIALPPIDLNNLFKYGWPVVKKKVPKGWITGTLQGILETKDTVEEIASAIAWAFWEVLNEKD